MNMTLMKLVMILLNCRRDDDLRKLDKWQKRYLAGKLEKLDPDFSTLEEWNRLGALTLSLPEAEDRETASERLICGLRAG